MKVAPSDKTTSKIIKRVKTIIPEISDLEPQEVKHRSFIYLAKQAKEIAFDYNCIIKTWYEDGKGFAECYNRGTFNHLEDNSYAEIVAETEEKAALVAFMWLSDRQNFIPNGIKNIREESM